MGFLDPNSWANALSDDPTGSKAAAQTQADWQNRAIDLQQQQFDTQQKNQLPWLQAGTGAVNTLAAGIASGGQFATTPQFKFDPNSVNVLQDPGYQFRLQSGVDALNAGASANGSLGSGNIGVALTQFGQNLGSQEYGAAYNRAYQNAMDTYNANMQGQNTLFNRLAGVAGTGQTTANQLMTAGMNNAANIGNQMGQIGANFGNAAVANRFLNNQAQSQLSQQAGQGIGNWLMADSGSGGNNASWLGTQMFGNAGQAGTLYDSSSMDMSNASMSDSTGWFNW